MRDAHLEVAAELDPLPLLAQMQSNPAANFAELSTLDEQELRDLLARANNLLEADTRIEVDGRRVAAEIGHAFDPVEIRRLLQSSAEGQHKHASLVSVVWEVKEPLIAAKRITAAFPAVLGPVLMTFVQPSTHYAAPGAPAMFSVLEKPANTASDVSKRSGWAASAVFLAVVAILLNARLAWQKRHERRQSS